MLNNYESGHPWYYYLGGKILTPKNILENAKLSNYQGYLENDVKKFDLLDEPKRTQKFNELFRNELFELKRNLSLYRKYVLEISLRRKNNLIGENEPICDDIYMSMSLKHNHIFSNFRHLILLESFQKQMDLFDF